MKFSYIATIFVLGAVAHAAQSDQEPAQVDALELAGGFLSPANETTNAALEEFATLAATGKKSSSCKRCDVYCASGAAGPDRRAVQIACATCIALELIANKGKRC